MGTLRSLIATVCRKWHFVRRWGPFRCPLFVSVWRRWKYSFGPTACLLILCWAMLATKSAVDLIFRNDCRESFNLRLYNSMPRKLKSPLPIFSHFRVRFIDQEFNFLHCSRQNLLRGCFTLSKYTCNFQVSTWFTAVDPISYSALRFWITVVRSVLSHWFCSASNLFLPSCNLLVFRAFLSFALVRGK